MASINNGPPGGAPLIHVENNSIPSESVDQNNDYSDDNSDSDGKPSSPDESENDDEIDPSLVRSDDDQEENAYFATIGRKTYNKFTEYQKNLIKIANSLRYYTSYYAIGKNRNEVIDILEQIDLLDGGYTEFDGSEYCEDCSGWDGISRRCQCDNRRVDWEIDSYGIRAEAY